MPSFGIVYLASYLGKSYVGQTKFSLEVRRKKHRNDSRTGSSYVFHKAIRKYGIDVFDWSVLEECSSQEALDEAERKWIASLETMIPNGYNTTPGGLALTYTPEIREKLRIANSKRKASASTREKISLALRGRVPHAAIEAIRGKPRTEETKRKMSASKRGKWSEAQRAALAKMHAERRLRAIR